MKYIFVINPVAGDGTSYEKLSEELKKYNGKYDYEIYKTTLEKDATEFTKEYCKNHSDEELTFVACGGDGSINEVVNGLRDYPNMILGVYSSGSGNDFVKHFGGKNRFLDLDKLFNGTVTPVDVFNVNDGVKDSYCINICNFGFDAYVAITANEVKKNGGKDPYGVGVKKALLHGRKNQITVIADGETLNPSGKMLLCTLGNGSYVGGKYKCSPRSKIDDGLAEVCLVDPITLIKFVQLMGKYEKGLHLDCKKFDKIIHYKRAKVIELKNDKPFDVCIDGEMLKGDHFRIEVLNKAIKLLVPQE